MELSWIVLDTNGVMIGRRGSLISEALSVLVRI